MLPVDRRRTRSLISLGDWPTATIAEWLLATRRHAEIETTAETAASEPSGTIRQWPLIRTAAGLRDIPATAREFVRDDTDTTTATADAANADTGDSLQGSPATEWRFVVGAPFLPRERSQRPRETGWSRLFRDDEIERMAKIGPIVNLGTPAHDPLSALAVLARYSPETIAGSSVMVVWHGPHLGPPIAGIAPVNVAHDVVLGVAQLASSRLIIAHPQGLELEPEIVAKAERIAFLRGAQLDIAYTPQAAKMAAEQASVVVSVPWGAINYYDDADAFARFLATLPLQAWQSIGPVEPALSAPPFAVWHRAAIRAVMEWAEQSPTNS